VVLARAVLQDVPEIDVKAGNPEVGKKPLTTNTAIVHKEESKKKSGCGCQATDRNGLLGGALLVGASLFLRRRRRPHDA
jgi:MYXO-CTERM domain-containing protein